MLTVASHQGRTVVGRLERGEDLLEGLRAVCAERQIRGGVITAIGALDTAEVTHYLPAQRAYGRSRMLDGPLELLSLQGNLSENEGELSIHLHVTLSREGDNGIEVLGGHLVSGRVYACEFCIFALDDVLLRRARDPDTGLRLWNQGFEQDADGTGRVVEPTPSQVPAGPEPTAAAASDAVESLAGVPDEVAAGPTPRAKRASSRAAPTPEEGVPEAELGAAPEEEEGGGSRTRRAPRTQSPSWDEVAAASLAVAREPAELPIRPDREARAAEEPVSDDEDDELADDAELEPGDIIEHPKFGRCRVERVEGEDEYVHVRLRNRNLVRLSLDVISLELIGSESGHQVFRARIG